MALSVFQSGDADVGNGIGNSNCCSKPNRFARLTAEAEVKKRYEAAREKRRGGKGNVDKLVLTRK